MAHLIRDQSSALNAFTCCLVPYNKVECFLLVHPPLVPGLLLGWLPRHGNDTPDAVVQHYRSLHAILQLL